MTETVPRRADLFLPDPEPREVRYTIISVDDHLSIETFRAQSS